jgi:hypothetical protein
VHGGNTAGGLIEHVVTKRLGQFAEQMLDLIHDFIPDDFQRHAIDEDPMRQAASLAVLNRGALIQGPAGIGKTEFIKQVIRKIHEDEPKARVYCCAETHVASRLTPNDRTIVHLLHRQVYNRMHNAWVIVDEASQVHLHHWARMAMWKKLECNFIFVGDFKGQFLPIGATTNPMEDSRQLHHLCNGMELSLSTYRRGADEQLFKRYTGLYKHVKEPLGHIRKLEGLRANYPHDEATAPLTDCVVIVLSHDKRRRINHHINDLGRRQRPSVLIKSPGMLKGTTQQPQDMYLWVGIELMGCSRSGDRIVNGVPYTVRALTDETVTVDMRREFWLNPEPSDGEVNVVLSHKETATTLRLTHALVYANVQGRTIRERHVVLLDTHHRHFSMRHLIVGMSRVTHGSYLHIPLREQEDKLMERAKPIPMEELAEQQPEDEDMGQDEGQDEDMGQDDREGEE